MRTDTFVYVADVLWWIRMYLARTKMLDTVCACACIATTEQRRNDRNSMRCCTNKTETQECTMWKTIPMRWILSWTCVLHSCFCAQHETSAVLHALRRLAYRGQKHNMSKNATKPYTYVSTLSSIEAVSNRTRFTFPFKMNRKKIHFLLPNCVHWFNMKSWILFLILIYFHCLSLSFESFKCELNLKMHCTLYSTTVHSACILHISNGIVLFHILP